MSQPALVGLLKCQTDSYLQTLKTVVHSCAKVKSGYEVEFADTVLFPEGGGQPFDTGICSVETSDISELSLVDGIQIKNVQRDGLRAVHTLDKPVEPGTQVKLSVDWPRRWDHMQQHTGQHLLSAVLDKRGLPTVGWNLGAAQSYIELPKKLDESEISEVQAAVNELIRESRPISLSVGDDIDHKVPENYDLTQGVLRVISIDGIDTNPCCGTHLRTTAHIQAIVLLHQVANKGNSRLFFLAGQRALDFASSSHAKLRSINSLLSCQTEDIEEKINNLNIRNRALQNQSKGLAASLAVFEAKDLVTRANSGLAVLHKPDLDFEYLRLVEKELKDQKGTFVLFSGQTGQPGAVIITGDSVTEAAKSVTEAVANVKGGGKGRWQGKVTKFGKGEVDALLALAI